MGADASSPTLQYSLYYDIQRNALTVNLGQAFNLPIRGKSSGSGDTSVILYMQPNKAEVFESKVVRKDLNPVFDQTFEFTGLLGVQVARQQTLIFKIYSRSRCVISSGGIGTYAKLIFLCPCVRTLTRLY